MSTVNYALMLRPICFIIKFKNTFIMLDYYYENPLKICLYIFYLFILNCVKIGIKF